MNFKATSFFSYCGSNLSAVSGRVTISRIMSSSDASSAQTFTTASVFGCSSVAEHVVVCRLCERQISFRLMAEHTRCCVLATQSLQEVAAFNHRLQTVASKLRGKISERQRLAAPATPLVEKVSFIASVLSALSQLWALAALWAIAAVALWYGQSSRGRTSSNASPTRASLRLRSPRASPSAPCGSAHASPASSTGSRRSGGGGGAAGASPNKWPLTPSAADAPIDPLSDTSLLEEAAAALNRLVVSEPTAVQSPAPAAVRTLQRAQAALEAADDFSGAAIVGAAAALALKRAAVLRVLADAELGANSTTPEAPSPRADQFAAGQWVDADDEPSFVRQAAVAERAGAEPADAIDNSGSPGWGEQQPVSSLAPLSENSTSSHRNGRPPSLQLPAAIVKEEGATSAAAPSVLRANVPSIADFQIIRPISKGAFGRVYLARKKATGDSFAVKVQRKDKALGRGASAKRVMSERDILVHADHPFVVKLFFCFQSRHNLYLVMEYLAGGDLHALLKRVGFLEEQLASIYLAEIVLGLEYLHEVLGIVHRDLKPENVLLSTSGHIKLTDFGLSWARVGNVGAENRSATTDDAARASILATQSSPPSIPTAPPAPVDTSAPAAESEDAHSNSQNARASRCFSVVGSPHYVAPEVLRATGHSTPVDWWALGVIAFELLTGRLPFGNGSISNVQDSVLAGDIKWPAGKEAQRISGVARDLISRLLMLHVKERLGTVRGALEVREHDFFRAVSWADLLRHNSFYIPLPTDAEAGPGAPQPSPPSPATGGPPKSPQSPIGSPSGALRVGVAA